jgi:hypothetical protein
VVAGDDEVDRQHLDIERQVIDLLGRHAPVASDLRLLTAILHINLQLERIGDMAVNVARLGQVVADAPRSSRSGADGSAGSRKRPVTIGTRGPRWVVSFAGVSVRGVVVYG